jgi:hypothetical protein
MSRYCRIPTDLYSLGAAGHVEAQDAKCGDLLNTQDGPGGH